MNSHERRVVERYWRHAAIVDADVLFDQGCWEWLTKNFGSCSFKRKNYPRWCWRPNYINVGSFAMQGDGAELYFRKEKDYTAFLLRWQQ